MAMKNYKVLFWLGIACFSLYATIEARGQGNCTSFDLDYICQKNEYVQAVSLDCGIACLNEGEECLVACMTEQLAVTNNCIGCFGDQVTCIVANCFRECAFGSEEDCAEFGLGCN